MGRGPRSAGDLMPPTVDVGAVCAELLSGLDPDTVEYIASGVVDDDNNGSILPRDDLLEFVAPLLEEICDGDDAKAQALAGTLYDKLVPDAPKKAKEKAKAKAKLAPAEIKMKLDSVFAKDENEIEEEGKGKGK